MRGQIEREKRDRIVERHFACKYRKADNEREERKERTRCLEETCVARTERDSVTIFTINNPKVFVLACFPEE